jgi:predicted dehydrogenase
LAVCETTETTMSKTYKAVAIGHTGEGGYGHGLHLPYRGLDNVEFAAVADPDEAGRAQAQAETGAPRSYADYSEMLRVEQPDIVSVCPRWTRGRTEMVMAALDAGAHIYCEKPLTSTLWEGDAIVAHAQEVGRKIAVAHQAVYLPRVQYVKQLLQDGRIGDVQAIYAHGKQDSRGGGEDMLVLGTHLFNMMRFFAGDVSWISAQVTANGRELEPVDVRQATEPVGAVAGDCVNAYFAFESGTVGFFDSRKDQAGAGTPFGMEIVGSQGRISLRGGFGDDLMIYPHPLYAPSAQEQRWEPLEEAPCSEPQDGNQLAIIDLIEAAEEDHKPLSADTDALAALEMILGTYESQISGARVAVPMTNRLHPLVGWTGGAAALSP